jgi:hypothetical protein
MQQGTDWNRHHDVGATLLKNWVEERATRDLILEERALGSKLDRHGHQVLIHFPKDIIEFAEYHGIPRERQDADDAPGILQTDGIPSKPEQDPGKPPFVLGKEVDRRDYVCLISIFLITSNAVGGKSTRRRNSLKRSRND